MPTALNLFEAFQKGIFKEIRLIGATTVEKPCPTYKHWLVLSGTVSHVTGTDTSLSIRLINSTGVVRNMYHWTPAATATHVRNLFSITGNAAAEDATHHDPNFAVYMLDDTMELYLSGDATCSATIYVLEW